MSCLTTYSISWVFFGTGLAAALGTSGAPNGSAVALGLALALALGTAAHRARQRRRSPDAAAKRTDA